MEGAAHGSRWGRAARSCLSTLEFTPAAFLTAVGSLGVSLPSLLQTPGTEGGACGYCLEPVATLPSLQVYRLITYIFFHEDLTSLVCSCMIIWYFGGGFEENVGTVKHLLFTFVFAVSSGLLYLTFHAMPFGYGGKEPAQGYTTVAFAMVSAATTRSRMRRILLIGFMIPTMLVPWLLLFVTLFIPHLSPVSNLCGVLVGIMYGLGGCFFLDPSEAIISKLDQKFPFSLLKRIPGMKYVPGTLAERKASQTRKINPPPGSYPTQQYYYPQPSFPASNTTLVSEPTSWHNYTPGHSHGQSLLPANTTAHGTSPEQNHMTTGPESHGHYSQSESYPSQTVFPPTPSRMMHLEAKAQNTMGSHLSEVVSVPAKSSD
ncbi:rhomboid domain-containing protein 2 [Microcaecilia unicolor]|uniref:Rhomboid domain-containing protein 2 n=1 Tax=Microcaecilia unicolor TaxID=1415580 RepID=A0A6P7ZWR7_9AMPH|nr:rhomboid domain-containing protein 2 [Microcaecilia unicolor]